MKKIVVLKAGFDPVTEEEIQQALAIRKSGCEVVLALKKEGILPLKKRMDLLKKAVRPWRHLSVQAECIGVQEIVEADNWKEQEAFVRSGCFYLAASGTKKDLVEEGLYFDEIVAAHCKPHRAFHTRSVASLCKELAHAHRLDEAQAWRCGMMHDITKKWSDEEGRRILSIYDPDKLSQNAKIWHSYTAPIWLRENLGMHDAKILRAIYAHTLGFGQSDLARILYIADKCERTRGYNSEPEIALAKKSLKDGAAQVLAESKKYLKETQGINA